MVHYGLHLTILDFYFALLETFINLEAKVKDFNRHLPWVSMASFGHTTHHAWRYKTVCTGGILLHLKFLVW